MLSLECAEHAHLEYIDFGILLHSGKEHVDVVIFLNALIVVEHGKLRQGVLMEAVVQTVVAHVVRHCRQQQRQDLPRSRVW